MTTLAPPKIHYPDSDGKPMADNTKQQRSIILIQIGLDALFINDAEVFIAGDLLWYPVQGQPKIRQAPDVLVVFGRPKGDRGSYKQWEEEGVAPQVVFEILSPGNTLVEMINKHTFYQRHGVQEYYLHDPDRNELFGWQRESDELRQIEQIEDFVSPLLGIRFVVGPQDLQLFFPDGRPFVNQVTLAQKNDRLAAKPIPFATSWFESASWCRISTISRSSSESWSIAVESLRCSSCWIASEVGVRSVSMSEATSETLDSSAQAGRAMACSRSTLRR